MFYRYLVSLYLVSFFEGYRRLSYAAAYFALVSRRNNLKSTKLEEMIMVLYNSVLRARLTVCSYRWALHASVLYIIVSVLWRIYNEVLTEFQKGFIGYTECLSSTLSNSLYWVFFVNILCYWGTVNLFK